MCQFQSPLYPFIIALNRWSPTTDLAAMWKTLVRGWRLVEVNSQLSSSFYPLSFLTSVFKKEGPFPFCQVCPFLLSYSSSLCLLGSLCSFALIVISVFFTAQAFIMLKTSELLHPFIFESYCCLLSLHHQTAGAFCCLFLLTTPEEVLTSGNFNISLLRVLCP